MNKGGNLVELELEAQPKDTDIEETVEEMQGEISNEVGET